MVEKAYIRMTENDVEDCGMGKRFNIAGSCISEKHYMVDTNEKIRQIIRLIEQDDYFTINRARQYGKTTSLLLVWKRLKDKYIVINTSFEGMGQDAFRSEDAFVRRFCSRVKNSLRLSEYSELLQKGWLDRPVFRYQEIKEIRT